MDDLTREKENGFDLEYLMDVPQSLEESGGQFQTPGFGLAAQLFSSFAKTIIEKLGPEEGEALLKDSVEYFGKERGKRIADKVKADGKPLSFKNWLIYTDIDASKNFAPAPDIENDDLVVKVDDCTFCDGAREWGLEDYAKIYCKYADFAIHEGYGAGVKLILEDRFSSGKDYCLFRFIMKEKNK